MQFETATIVPGDRFVAFDREGYHFDFEAAAPMPNVAPRDIMAIQWFGDHGQVEVSRGPARGFEDRSIVEHYLPLWLAARAEFLSTQAGMAQARRDAEDQGLSVGRAALEAMEADVAKLDALPDALKDQQAAQIAFFKRQLEQLRADVPAREARFAAAVAAAEQAEAKAAQAQADLQAG